MADVRLVQVSPLNRLGEPLVDCNYQHSPECLRPLAGGSYGCERCGAILVKNITMTRDNH